MSAVLRLAVAAALSSFSVVLAAEGGLADGTHPEAPPHHHRSHECSWTSPSGYYYDLTPLAEHPHTFQVRYSDEKDEKSKENQPSRTIKRKKKNKKQSQKDKGLKNNK